MVLQRAYRDVIRPPLKAAAKTVCRQLGFEVTRLEALAEIPKRPHAAELLKPIQPWNTITWFDELYSQFHRRTLVAKVDCFMLYQLMEHAASAEGDVAEVGVYKGGTAMLLAHLARMQKKQLHLFDTFKGMPPTDPEKDWHKEGDFSDTTLQSVQQFLQSYSNVQIYAGLFPETAGPIEEARFSFVHVDVDIYASVKSCCDFFYDRITEGGVIVFDDYGKVTCLGAKQAVDEFFMGKREKPFYLPTGQSFLIKRTQSAFSGGSMPSANVLPSAI